MPFSLLEEIIGLFWQSEEQKIFSSFMSIVRDANIEKEELEKRLEKMNFLGNIEIIKGFCLKKDGGTPLHQATLYGNRHLVKFLLSQKNNFKFGVNDTDSKRFTPLHNASICVIRNYSMVLKSKEKIWQVIDYLLEEGAKHELRDSKGKTPLDIIKSYDDEFLSKRYSEIVRLTKFKKDEITYREYISKELEILINDWKKLKKRVSNSQNFSRMNFPRNTISSIMTDNDYNEINVNEIVMNRREFNRLIKV